MSRPKCTPGIIAFAVSAAVLARWGGVTRGAEPSESKPRPAAADAQPDRWKKAVEDRARRGTLEDVRQSIRGDTGKWSDEPRLQHAPPIQSKPRKLPLDEWSDQLLEQEFQLSSDDDNWLLFRTRQLDDNDRIWVERIARRGNQLTVVAHQAVWQGRYQKNFTGHVLLGVNLGQLEPGTYQAKWIIKPLVFNKFDDPARRLEAWPDDERPDEKQPTESRVTFTVAAGDIPEPSCDRIDYTRPRDYLVLHESLGDTRRIDALAATLKSRTPEQTLLAIGRWIETHLKYDASAAYEWRNVDAALDTKVYGSCADHAVVFAALARACEIPTVFVKTMDADWIREFRTTGSSSTWRGHVFLEMFLDGRWRLLDAQALYLYEDYDPVMRILPGNRYAYDKGSDPRELILSLDWERWKQQTAAYFGTFDLTRLPVGGGRPLNAVYVAANSPVYQAVTRRLQALGYPMVYSFNTEFERYLQRAKGGRLIITCVGDTVVLPEAQHARLLPVSRSDLMKRMEAEPAGVLRKQLDDGTAVVLIYGKDTDAIQKAIATFKLTDAP